MRKLSFVIGSLFIGFLSALAMIPLIILWLLGANDPVGNWIEFCDNLFKDSKW